MSGRAPFLSDHRCPTCGHFMWAVPMWLDKNWWSFECRGQFHRAYDPKEPTEYTEYVTKRPAMARHAHMPRREAWR